MANDFPAYAGANTISVQVGDVNNDGSLDMVLGNNGGANVYLINDGHGSFTQGGFSDRAQVTMVVALAVRESRDSNTCTSTA